MTTDSYKMPRENYLPVYLSNPGDHLLILDLPKEDTRSKEIKGLEKGIKERMDEGRINYQFKG